MLPLEAISYKGDEDALPRMIPQSKSRKGYCLITYESSPTRGLANLIIMKMKYHAIKMVNE
jgi:hypothetical protein